MKIYEEKSLKDFEFWAGAQDTVKYFTDEEMEVLEECLNELYPEGLEETQLNDIFWHDADFLAELVGYNEFGEIMTERGKV